jgi:hypothetical protein
MTIEHGLMKKHLLFSGSLLVFSLAHAGIFPVITAHPQNQTVAPGNTATFSVTATGATGYQWRFNGTNINGGTSSALQVPSAQAANAGYYMVVARNETGWVPSQMAYLSVADPVLGGNGTVPLSNQGNSSAQACYQFGDFSTYGQPINGGSARTVAGPALDQMQSVGSGVTVNNGYFNGPARNVPTVAPGETVYYRVDVSYSYSGHSYTQRSTVLKLVAGGGLYPTPSAASLRFPLWPEWPEPWYEAALSSPTNQLRVPGETVTLSNYCYGYGDFGIPKIQWRKDGVSITPPLNFADFSSSSYTYFSCNNGFTITNLQLADAGIYDAAIFGDNWLTTPRISLSIQVTNGPGVLRSPRMCGTDFVCDLEGAASRSYTIQWSADLSTWNDLRTLSNATGTVTFTNALPPEARRFYRTVLMQ